MSDAQTNEWWIGLPEELQDDIESDMYDFGINFYQSKKTENFQ